MALGRLQQLLARGPCDETGWPEHGHLIWASPNWWTAKSAAHGLRRDVAAERVIHHRLGSFFDDHAPGRRSLFVLYGPGRTAVLDRRYDASRRRSCSFARACTVNRGPNQS